MCATSDIFNRISSPQFHFAACSRRCTARASRSARESVGAFLPPSCSRFRAAPGGMRCDGISLRRALPATPFAGGATRARHDRRSALHRPLDQATARGNRAPGVPAGTVLRAVRIGTAMNVPRRRDPTGSAEPAPNATGVPPNVLGVGRPTRRAGSRAGSAEASGAPVAARGQGCAPRGPDASLFCGALPRTVTFCRRQPRRRRSRQ